MANSHAHFLKELLNLASKDRKKQNSQAVGEDATKEVGQPRPTAFDVLLQLLADKVVSQESVTAAHEACNKRESSKRNAESSADAGQAVASESTEVVEDPRSKQNTNASVIRTRHIALRFYYDGGTYSGLAEHIGMQGDNSIEKALFSALTKARLLLNCGEDARSSSGYSRCGRTDKGVSAAGQVVAFQLRSAYRADATWDAEGQRPVETSALPNNSHESLTIWAPPKKGGPNAPRQRREMTEYAYDKILNNLLPPDIRILGWTPVSDDFSARFSAATRTYRYFFLKRQMDLNKIRQGLALMVGRHDFRNLCKMDVEKVYNFERVIHRANIVEDAGDSGVCFLEIHGQAFLWHQIRCIASVLFMIGRGLEEPEVVSDLLNIEKCPGKPGYPLADERPLVLHDCGYPNLYVGYSVQNLWRLLCLQEEQLEDLVLAAARIRNCIQSLDAVTVDVGDLSKFCLSKLKERAKKSRNGATSPGELKTPFTSQTVSWGDAVDWMRTFSLFAGPDGARDMAHIPLLQRSKGTTYEEKVAAVQQSAKRRQKYEENVIKKRKTKEEDEAFYAHKIKQGSTLP